MGRAVLASRLLLAGIVSICSTWMPAVTAQGALDTGASVKGARDKLLQELHDLQARGYEITHPVVVDDAESSGKSFRVRLSMESPIVIATACGINCSHVQLTLYDQQRHLIAKTSDSHAVVIVLGVPTYTGDHEIDISVPGCRAQRCEIAFVILREGNQPDSSPPAVAAEIEYPQEALPPELPLSADILQIVESHPFFANAPQVVASSYNVDSTTRSVTSPSGHEARTSTSEGTTVAWLRRGIVLLDGTSTQTSITVGGTVRARTQNASIAAANGLFALAHKSVWESSTGVVTTSSSTMRIENLVGAVFPVATGNRYAYDLVMKVWSSAGYVDETTTKNSCEVLKALEAASFHPRLAGNAFVLECNVKTTHKKNKQGDYASTTRDVYFEALGIWISVDPSLPKQAIIQTGEPVVMGRFTTKTMGAYTLKAFGLAR